MEAYSFDPATLGYSENWLWVANTQAQWIEAYEREITPLL
jgi:hypothetical protein